MCFQRERTRETETILFTRWSWFVVDSLIWSPYYFDTSTLTDWQFISPFTSKTKQKRSPKINLCLSWASFLFLFPFEYKTTFLFPFFSFSFVKLSGSKHSFEIIVLFTVCVDHIFFGSVPSETCPVNRQNFQIEMCDMWPFFFFIRIFFELVFSNTLKKLKRKGGVESHVEGNVPSSQKDKL